MKKNYVSLWKQEINNINFNDENGFPDLFCLKDKNVS